ncbi:hypothetical protein CKO15_09435 [Halorhodospira abdelmalekii]|uniref:hypothetical protein n=1 Tax=Halorhodospira abdelmalekii TaxID=421629 RepID=UPI001903A53C|nr:hypothetical protein [Halorhodospira abdelmalekii]MBK1735501.1 hypothetical protein [Halorhodospira abdelmalekii]
MALAEADREHIDAYIQSYLERWLAEQERRLIPAPAVYDRELHERVVRVEEALKHQGELMQRAFAQIDKRFEQVDKRFEQVDKRFEQVDKRFEEMIRRQDKQHHLVLGFIVGSLGLMITVMLTAMRFMG